MPYIYNKVKKEYVLFIVLLALIVSCSKSEETDLSENPTAPISLKASLSATSSNTVKLEWNAPSKLGKNKAGETSKILKYAVAYDNNKAFSSPKSLTEIKTTNINVEKLAVGEWFFKVKAINDNGVSGKTNSPFSEVVSFKIEVPEVPKPNKTSVTIRLKGNVVLPEKFELAKGGSVVLEAIVQDNKPVTWSSSNTAVVTVNNGEIIGLLAGTATITATLNEDKSKTSAVDITVIYRDYRSDLFGESSKGPWRYYIKSLKTEGGTSNINYSYNLPAPVPPATDGEASKYEYIPKTSSSGSLTISKKSKKLTVKIETGRDGSIAALWIDWELDGYFAGNSDTSNEENDFYFVGTPGVNNTAGVLTAEITIPDRARIGKGRMRMVVNWSGDNKFPKGKFWTYNDSSDDKVDNGNIWLEDSGAARDFDVEITE